MKWKLLHGLAFLLLATCLFSSCQKELSCESCIDPNQPPIALAGPDLTITLPIDSVILDGTGSTDPDGTIASYKWTKISGPVSSNILRPDSSKTLVKTLVRGVYKFELTVTDNGGLSAKDTVQVIMNDLVNHSPIANAGSDQIITLPNNTITLDGSLSTDPENNITGYVWTKISGPSSFNIANVNATQTQVTNLVEGVYQFELKVSDIGGLFSKDTMQVIVNAIQPDQCGTNRSIINAQLIPFGTLSVSRTSMTIATAGTKILFAGGDDMSNGGDGLTRVDIYDTVTHGWSTAELSVSRWSIAAVTLGNKIFFAGGHTNSGNSWDLFATVDIYDASTNTWSTAQLSERRMDVAVATVGNKVFFAGGNGGDQNFAGVLSNKVDIYDNSNNTWSTATLSEARSCISAVSAGSKIYFAGGNNIASGGYGLSCNPSNRIDIFDNATNSWSVSTMSIPLTYRAGISINNKIFLAGGENFICNPYTHNLSSNVEILDINAQTSSFACLFQPNAWPGDRYGNQQTNAVLKDNKIIFFAGEASPDKFDIYDIATQTWLIGSLSVIYSQYRVSIISINNTIYVADGGEVWKLEF